jgi:hypothetical protein
MLRGEEETRQRPILLFNDKRPSVHIVSMQNEIQQSNREMRHDHLTDVRSSTIETKNDVDR